MASKKSVAATKTATKSKRPAAFISAPPDVNTSELAGALEARGLNVLRADEIGIGMSWSESLRQSLKRADYVIAVVGERPNANVLYELGMASGMDKPVLVLASLKSLSSPSRRAEFRAFPRKGISPLDEARISLSVARTLSFGPATWSHG